MAILIDKNTKVIIQGFTGRTGYRKRHLTCLFPGEHPARDGRAELRTRDGKYRDPVCSFTIASARSYS